MDNFFLATTILRIEEFLIYILLKFHQKDKASKS